MAAGALARELERDLPFAEVPALNEEAREATGAEAEQEVRSVLLDRGDGTAARQHREPRVGVLRGGAWPHTAGFGPDRPGVTPAFRVSAPSRVSASPCVFASYDS